MAEPKDYKIAYQEQVKRVARLKAKLYAVRAAMAAQPQREDPRFWRTVLKDAQWQERVQRDAASSARAWAWLWWGCFLGASITSFFMLARHG